MAKVVAYKHSIESFELNSSIIDALFQFIHFKSSTSASSSLSRQEQEKDQPNGE